MLIAVTLSILSTLGLGIYRHHVEDRLPLVPRIMNALGVALFFFFGAWAAIEAPVLLIAGIGAFVTLNVLNALLTTSQRLDGVPAHPSVWLEPLADLRRTGWSHIGTWHMNLGGKVPEVAIYERPDDGARLMAIGTAAQGGIVEIQTLLDGGRGYLVTLNKKSHTVRPPWMFKQSLVGESISELVRAHDGASQYLSVMGVTPSHFPSGDPLEATTAENRMLRRFFMHRWWLVAIQPVVVFLAPSRVRHLHEQADIDKQVRRYAEWISREQTSPFPIDP
jgi:hypothetical protein